MQNKSVHHIYTHTIHIIAAEHNHTWNSKTIIKQNLFIILN